MAIGRISGPLLKANLQRDRVDLAFETDLIYLQVTDALAANHRVGIKTSSPAYTLDVNGTTRTTNFKTGLAEIDDVNINNNKIKSSVGNLIIEAATLTDRVQIGAANIPNIYGDVRIDGNLHTTGNITADGDIVIGDQDTDSIVFNADVKSNIIPDVTDTYNLGIPTKRWLQVNTNNANIGDLALGTNLIETTQPDQDLHITANGSGQVIINDLFSVGGSSVTFEGTDLTVGNLLLNGDGQHTGVSSIDSNTDFYVGAAGTGQIYLQSNVIAEQDLAVNGGDVITTAATFNLVNNTATTVNFAGASTTTTIGALTGTTTVGNDLTVNGDVLVKGGDVTTTATTASVFDTTATTVNAFRDGTAITIGATTGTTTIRNANVVLDGDLAVNGGDLTTTSTTFNLVNTDATTINFAGAGTSVTVGNDTGTLTLRNPTVVGVNTTQDLFNTVATTVNFAGAATDVQIGSATGTTTINNNLQVDGSANITGDVTIGGNIRIGDKDLDTITVVADFTSDLVPDVSNTYNLGTPTKTWNNLFVSALSNGDIIISGNTITTSQSNSDLELDAAGTGTIELKTNSNITGTLGVTQNVTLDSDLAVNGGDLTTTSTTFNLLTTNAETINFADAVNVLNIAKLDSTTTIKGMLNVDQQSTLASVNVEDLTSGRVVLAGTNGELEDSPNLTFNGSLLTVTGDQRVTGNLDVDGNIRLGGNIYIGDQPLGTITVVADFTSDLVPQEANKYNLGTAVKSWQNVYAGQVNVSGLQLNSTVISTVDSNADLVLDPAGTGTVYINSDQALKIPVGDTTVRPTGTTGEIRFNTTTSQFEGFNGTAWSSLGGVRDIDGNTYIIPEASTGANDNTLYFYTGGNLSATLNSTRFDTIRITVDDIAIDSNIIETTTADTNLELRAAGTGYVSFTNTNAIKIPVGTTAQRLSGVTGQVRFNSETTQFEGYNGTAWSSLGGVRDVDGNTYIIPEASTGANDNTLWFYNDGVLSATLTKTALTLNPTTGSTSTTTGALVVNGGAGIAENIYLGSDLVGSGVTTSEIDSFTINGGEY